MRTLGILFGIFYITLIQSDAYIVDPGPQIKATKGEIWPKPKEQKTQDTFSIIKPGQLKFQATNYSCAILENAVDRYKKIISGLQNPIRKRVMHKLNSERIVHTPLKSWRSDPNFNDLLTLVKLELKAKCEEYPYLGMNEAYTLTVDRDVATIESYSIWGLLWGLESFSQLIVLSEDGGALKIKTTKINDEPRFSHRGLLVDTSRHFISVPTLIEILDGMAYNKLNVFHWHIVDDHSFPYTSTSFPELSEQGAYHPKAMVYSQEEVKRVIEEARVRGIRVMSEFDTPGHTRSWGVSHPEILTECHGKYEGKLGPMDITKNETYDFVFKLMEEIVDVFPDKYVHLGGDEVGFECWNSSSTVLKFMEEHNFTSFEQLEEFYIQKLVNEVDRLNASSLVWQEVYENGVKLPNGTVVHVWTGDRNGLMDRITQDGLPVLMSACWYLDHLDTGGDWKKYYDCDPYDFNGTIAQNKLVMGGEGCMWAEVVNDHNILQRIFPRISAIAEKLWSPQNADTFANAAKRLEEHTCRMNIRGIPAQPPNGPGFCI